MAEEDVQAAVDRLQAAPLDAWVAERTRLARELRAAGDREGAAELAKLPKPSAAAWALNEAAREDPTGVEAWAGAAAGLREASAHAARLGGDAVRAAMAAHREATDGLVDGIVGRARPGGRPLSGAMVERVRALLQAAAADAEQAALVRAGRVTEEPRAPALLRAGAAGESGADGKRKAADGKRKAAAGKRKAAAEERKATEERRAAEKREAAERRAGLQRQVDAAAAQVARLRAEAARRRELAGMAADAADRARRALDEAEREVAATRTAAGEAAEAADAAEGDLQRVRALLRRATG